jgi:Domain of unknown function (DUF1707)
MATGSNIRVGDAERDATATQLREHYATGRLTLDELNERLDQTFKARTGADLNAVMRDLPPMGSPWAGATAGTGGFGASGQSPRTSHQLGGSQSQWGPQAPGGQWGGQGDQGNGSGARRGGLSAVASLIPVLLAVGALFVLGSLFAFGFGGGRPLGIVFFLAAVALIRRLFGGRRGFGRRYGRCGRRW